MRNTQKIVILSFIAAITFILGLTPVGLIPLPVVKATTLFIPITVGIIYFKNLKVSIFLGVLFGCTSMYNAYFGSAPSPIFQNPIMAIVPRVLMAVSTHYVYVFVSKVNVKRPKMNFFITGFFGAFLNTLFTMTFMWLMFRHLPFKNGDYYRGIYEFTMFIVMFVAPVEWAVGCTASGAISMALYRSNIGN